MGRYITESEVIARSARTADVGSVTNIDSAYIVYAEAFIESELSGYFTTPFSDNNLTAKDLAIDESFRRIIQYRDTEKADSLAESIASRIEALRGGVKGMALIDGTIIASQGLDTVWSSTEEYHPTFTMDKPEHWVVSSEQINDLRDERD